MGQAHSAVLESVPLTKRASKEHTPACRSSAPLGSTNEPLFDTHKIFPLMHFILPAMTSTTLFSGKRCISFLLLSLYSSASMPGVS